MRVGPASTSRSNRRLEVSIAVVVLAMLSLSSARSWAAEVPPQVLRVDARPSVLFVSFAPLEIEGSASHEAILDLDALLLEQTGLLAKSAEQAGIQPSRLRACEAERRLSCWLRELEVVDTSAVRYLLVLGAHPAEDDQERWSFILIGIQEAREAAPDRSSPAAEGLIDRVTTWIEPTLVKATDPRSRRDALQKIVLPALLEKEKALGADQGIGEIRLEAVEAGLELLVDGRVVGLSDGRALRMVDVRPGERRLSARDGDAYAVELPIQVTAGRVTQATLPIPSRRRPTGGKQLMMWSGGATAALGISLLAIGLAAGSGDVRVGCFVANGSDANCGGLSNAAVRGIDGTPQAGSNFSSGLGLEAIGSGLLVGGTSWFADGLFAESELALWLLAGLGAVLGAGTTVLVHAASGG